ncbi:MAG TPA: hypothetical protein PLG47_03260 [Candidatus Dojkabacteria bacterium]|nr:hypothetical protein [Candidatus Dojkabacteria bacterium]
MNKYKFKPNFEIVNQLLKSYRYDEMEITEDENWELQWIIKSENHQDFINLIEDYELQAHYSNLLFIGITMLNVLNGIKYTVEEEEKEESIKKELNNAKELINEIEHNKLEIHLLSLISNKKAVLKYPENTQEIIELILSNSKDFNTTIKRRGRRRKHFNIQFNTFLLFIYLQKYTILKTSNSLISNKQAKFIFDFFNILLIYNLDETTFYEADIIRKYFKEYVELLKREIKNENDKWYFITVYYYKEYCNALNT